MVARCGVLHDAGFTMHGPYPPPTGDYKGAQPLYPTALAPTESRIEAYVDVYWWAFMVARIGMK